VLIISYIVYSKTLINSCTLLISQFASASGCPSFQIPGSVPFQKIRDPSPANTLHCYNLGTILRYDSVSNVWFMLCYVTVMQYAITNYTK